MKKFLSLIATTKAQLLLITFVTLITFINIFPNKFAIDDKTFIGGWESAKHLSNIPKFFQGAVPEGHQGVYRPIRHSLMAVYYKVFGTNAFWYHLHSLVVHLSSTILVFYIVRLLVSKDMSLRGAKDERRSNPVGLRLLLRQLADRNDKGQMARNDKSDFIPFAAALLFALHPIHTETIDYISASLDATGLVFLFLSFWLYLRSRIHLRGGVAPQSNAAGTFDVPPAAHLGGGHRIEYLGSLVSALLAFFTYEVTLVLPLLLVLYEVCFPRHSGKPRQTRRIQNLSGQGITAVRDSGVAFDRLRLPRMTGFFSRLRFSLPYFALAAIFFVIRFFLLHITARGPYLAGSAYFTFLTMSKVFFSYIMLLIYPFNLSLNHIISKGIEAFVYRDYRTEAILAQSLFDKDILLGLLGVLGLLGLAIKLYRKYPIIAFCIGWFFIALLPVSEIVPQGSMMNEKFLYLPSFGFVLILSVILNRLFVILSEAKNPLRFLYRGGDPSTLPRLRSESLRMTILLLIALFYGILTFQRNFDWKNDITIWSKDVQNAPKENAYAHFDLGNAYEENGQLALALKEYQKSFDINPHFVVALASKGVVYANMGKIDLAIETYKKAVTISPYFWEGHNNLGNIYLKEGKTDLAEAELRQAVAMNPNFLPARLNLESLLSDKIGTASAKDNWTKYSFNKQFSFKYPATWTLEIRSYDTLTMTSDTKTFKVEFFQDTRRDDLSAQDYVERDTASFGKLVNQGLAKIPNADFGFVKVWDPMIGSGGRPKLQFFLFKGKKVVQLVVFPGDSPFMKQLDSILASISL